jgi:outer membrane protein assembly factor BamA
MKWFLLALLLFLVFPLIGQKSWYVKDIELKGNRRTQAESILRELDFVIGDVIKESDWKLIVGRNKNRLLNKGLFYFVHFELKEHLESENASIAITFKEYGILGIGLNARFADRNFNIWLQQKRHYFDRLNFTFRLSLNNFDGRNQRFELNTQFGYTEMLQFRHQLPYLNRNQTIGASIFGHISRNKELNYNTIEDRQVFQVIPSTYLFHHHSAGFLLNYRPEHLWSHFLEFKFSYLSINPFVIDSLNKSFFKGDNKQSYEEVNYSLVYENRDRIIYPSEGHFLKFFLNKKGVILNKDVNLLNLGAQWQANITFTKFWSYQLESRSRISLLRHDPGYFQNRAIGDRLNTIRGYELFVFEGLDYSFLKQSLRYKLFDIKTRSLNFVPGQRFKNIPIEIYLSSNFDFGYINNPFATPGNNLTNKLLYGGGFGIDFVVMNDKFIRFELSSNQTGLTGLYLHSIWGIPQQGSLN